MEKSKRYLNALFDQKILRTALTAFRENALTKINSKEITKELSVTVNKEHWRFDDFEEFYAAYANDPSWARLSVLHNEAGIKVDTAIDQTEVSVRASTRSSIESVFSIFEQAITDSNYTKVKSKTKKPVIFIGHGRSLLWRDLKDHLTDQHGYSVQAYEVGARAGHTIRDILDDMLAKSTFACLVMTGDDEVGQATFRARQNVIHEIGLFQGRLGFSRAVVLLEDGTEEFSNIQGIHQIRFSKGNIREAYGDVLATLKREFG